MKKRILFVLAALCLLLAGCGAPNDPALPKETAAPAPLTKYNGTFYDSFDTITQLIGYTADEETFNAVLADVQSTMLRYHKIFDGYNAYDGIHNLYEVNQNAAKGPAPAEKELIDLLLWIRDLQPKLGNRVNVAMGSVLSVWHEYRTEGKKLPPMEMLKDRAQHVNMDDVIIDPEKCTVYFADPELKVDLGAVAKGYTVEIIASELLTDRMPSYIINAGGNVRCGAKPADGRASWGISIQDPGDGKSAPPSSFLDVLYLKDTSAVTSGDYQRYYEVDGVRYHHIIDPDTQMPSRFVRSVTVVTGDSGLADALSTTLFLMPYEDGRALVDSMDQVEAYWVLMDQSIQYTDGLKPMLLSAGASASI